MPLVTAPPLAMTAKQRKALEQMARSTWLPHRKVVQGSAPLLAADGLANNEVARQCNTTNDSVRAWRRRFEVEGVEGSVRSHRDGAARRGCPKARSRRWWPLALPISTTAPEQCPWPVSAAPEPPGLALLSLLAWANLC
jgi:hypothetical protein